MGNTAPSRSADTFPRSSAEGPADLGGFIQELCSLTGTSTEVSLLLVSVCCGHRSQTMALWAALLHLGHTLNTVIRAVSTAHSKTHLSPPLHIMSSGGMDTTGHVSVYEVNNTLVAAQGGCSEPEGPPFLQRTLEHSAPPAPCDSRAEKKASQEGSRSYQEPEPDAIANSPGSH